MKFELIVDLAADGPRPRPQGHSAMTNMAFAAAKLGLDSAGLHTLSDSIAYASVVHVGGSG